MASIDPSLLMDMSGDLFDDSTPFINFPDLDDDGLFSTSWDEQEVLPGEDTVLYSLPPNWDAVQPKIEAVSPDHVSYPPTSILTLAQQERLRNIAMPQLLDYSGKYSPTPESSTQPSSSASSSPESHNQNRKRKSSADADEDDDEDASSQHPVKKTAHNMIEQRYRTNLSDKIAALRDSVPSLRIMTKSARGEDTTDDVEELQGLAPAHKLNKATILSKATEYINHLKKRNTQLEVENKYMKGRIDAFEELYMSGSMGIQPPPQYAQRSKHEGEKNPSDPSGGEPQGMIPVPEDIKRLRTQAVQQQSFVVPQAKPQTNGRPAGPAGWQTGGNYLGRLMVGSLAGLMIMEGFSEAEQDTDTPGARGLFALPIELLRSLRQTLYSSMNLNILGYRVSASQTLGYLKVFLVLWALLFAFLPAIFASTPKSATRKTRRTSTAAASPASPIQVRRQAWLTAIESFWVPRGNFFLEAATLALKAIVFIVQSVIGRESYASLTGINQHQDAATVNAWETALDAQLAGGDVEVSKRRLMLTLLASGTLPVTPARLMLNALHIRVLMWEVGNAGFNGLYMFREFSARLARWKWNEARQLQQSLRSSEDPQAQDLPKHLAALLEQECDDVLVDSIGQRAYNLTWNLPTTHNAKKSSGDMDAVVEDLAVRSPLDAVSAWFSSLILQSALSKGVESTPSDEAMERSMVDDIALAVKTAPVGSGSHVRALVARAVLVKEGRGATIAAALQVLGPAKLQRSKNEATPTNTLTSIPTLPDIAISLNCAMAIAYLQRFPSPSNPEAAHALINSMASVDLTLLSFTALFKLIEAINSHEIVAVSCNFALERLAGSLRIWIGSRDGEKSGLDREAKRDIVDRCLTITRRVVGMQDAGYESMSDPEINDGC